MSASRTSVTVLGLGEMGRALAAASVAGGHRTTVWNRSPGKADELVAVGAHEANSFHGAVASSRLLIVCVRDYASARASLEPEAGVLAGRSIVNLTTGTPGEARAMAAWAAEHGVGYVDGGIMAIPAMIGGTEASILYSGSSDTFTAHRDVVNLFGSARYLGEDAGMAAMQDLAMLAGMYAMFAGAYHAFAMVSSVGVEATDFAGPLGGWLRAMTASLPGAAALIDAGDFSTDVQDLEFTRMALDTIIQATDEAGVGSDVLEPVRAMVERQIIAGHGDDHFNRMIESIRTQ